MAVVAKEYESALAVYFAAWKNIHAKRKQTCPACGQFMLYLGESCNTEGGIDLEYKCTCKPAIYIISE
jgi:hypothetical protein